MKVTDVIIEGRNDDVPVYYFAYGMLTDPKLMQGLKLVGVGELHNFEYNMYAWANVEPSPKHSVYGCLWAIDRQVISQLDKAEGYPNLYDRRTYPVICNGKKYAAEVYVMTPSTLAKVEDSQPTQAYVDRIVRGYQNAGVPMFQLERALQITGIAREKPKRDYDPTPWSDEQLDEAPLPPDWDPQEFKQGASSFRSRLAYAIERAKKIGTGSSRVAMIIEYEGRQTALKIAKNRKGLAQNNAEASILDDGYASQLGILIPIIDYDKESTEPLWIQTELAAKATEKSLCDFMKCRSLQELVTFAKTIGGRNRYDTVATFQQKMRNDGVSDEDIETCTGYANTLADLMTSFDIELGDFSRAANWGWYQRNPVIIDIGLTTDVYRSHY